MPDFRALPDLRRSAGIIWLQPAITSTNPGLAFHPDSSVRDVLYNAKQGALYDVLQNALNSSCSGCLIGLFVDSFLYSGMFNGTLENFVPGIY